MIKNNLTWNMGLVRDTLLRISTFNKFVNQKVLCKKAKTF